MAYMDTLKHCALGSMWRMKRYMSNYDPFFDHFDGGRCLDCGDFKGDNNLPGSMSEHVAKIDVFLIPPRT